MNYRDLQNISYLTQEILIENAGEEYNPINRWPYTSPYLQEAYVDEERAPGVKPYKPRNLKPLPSEKPLSGETGDGSGYGDITKFTQDTDRNKFKPGKTVPPKKTFGKIFRIIPHGIGAHKDKMTSNVTKITGGDPGEPQAKVMPRMKSKPSREIVHHKKVIKDSYDLYDLILSHLLDEGYASSVESAEAIMVNMSEEWRDCIMEKEDSEYEKASDAALDSRYGYGRAQGDKRSFGRAANRSSAAAALRALRRGERSGSGTSTEAGADAVHQGWARTARTSADQTPEKKERRAKLADTSYSDLPDDEKEKDRVSFNAVKATYNRNK